MLNGDWLWVVLGLLGFGASVYCFVHPSGLLLVSGLLCVPSSLYFLRMGWEFIRASRDGGNDTGISSCANRRRCSSPVHPLRWL